MITVPRIFESNYTTLVSCYAFFKGWPLPTPPPNGQHTLFSYTLHHNFETLANGLGCFPFDHEPSHPQSVCYHTIICIRSFTKFSKNPFPRT